MNPGTEAKRPRVLLIPNTGQWILAYMCAQIRAALGAQFDFFIIPETLFEARPQLWPWILPQVDIVHCMNESSALILQAHGGTSLPVISWIHHVTKWSAEHQAASEISAALVASTQGWKREIARYSAKPISVIRHGVDSEQFRSVQNARQKFGIPSSDFVVGLFGSKGSDFDANRKGTDTLLEVALRCAREIPNLHVLLLGPGWDVKVFEEAGVRVTYPGFVPAKDLPAAYSALDLYLMTARVEGGPVTVLESMACGTPVVATRVGLVPDVVVNGVNGMTAEVGDVDALSAAVCRMAAEPGLRARLAAEARATAVGLGWAGLLAPLAEVYCGIYPAAETKAMAGKYSSGQVNRAAIAAEAVLKFRYALAADLKTRNFAKSKAAFAWMWQTVDGWGTLVGALGMARRGKM